MGPRGHSRDLSLMSSSRHSGVIQDVLASLRSRQKAARFTAAELVDASFTAAELVDAKYTTVELKAAGYSTADIKAAMIAVNGHLHG